MLKIYYKKYIFQRARSRVEQVLLLMCKYELVYQLILVVVAMEYWIKYWYEIIKIHLFKGKTNTNKQAYEPRFSKGY